MKPLPPRIGMSLSPRYLTDDPDHAQTQLFGPADVFLADLVASSASSVELRAINPGTEVELALAALQRVRDAGLSPTIHGSLPPMACGDDWPQAIPALTAMMERLRQHGAPRCPIALHAYAEQVGDAAALADQTVVRLAQMADWIERERMPVTLALELNRDKGEVDPSITYRGVLDMHERVGHARVGVCWDFGHTWANVLQGRLEPDAPAAFAQAVTHTHIHDLGSSGRTHWPLTEGRLPLDRFVQALQRAGYAGVWNLELSPDRFESEGDARGRTLASITRLREAILASGAAQTL